MTAVLKALFLFIGAATMSSVSLFSQSPQKSVRVGVYYFDGWSGKTTYAKDPNAPWAKNAPTHLTEALATDFAGREPVWGWRDDSLEIMERQIDLAADSGVDFFLFCWYWSDNKKSINLDKIAKDSKHTSLELYMKAKNRDRVRFAINICNHAGYEILGTENWAAVGSYLSKYFNDSQYVKVGRKPFVVIFGARAAGDKDLASLQKSAKSAGIKNGLSIAGCGSYAEGKKGFTHKTHYNYVPGYSGGSYPRSYRRDLVEVNKTQWTGTEQQPYIPSIASGWDKRPWEGERGARQPEGYYYINNTPLVFKNYFEDAIKWMDDNPTKTTKERIILIYAWNELGEGGYLVPTKDEPEALKLQAIRSVVKGE